MFVQNFAVFKIVLELMSNCCWKFVELLSNYRFDVELSNCVALLSNYWIFCQNFVEMCRVVVEFSICCRIFVELLLNCQVLVEILSNCQIVSNRCRTVQFLSNFVVELFISYRIFLSNCWIYVDFLSSSAIIIYF